MFLIISKTKLREKTAFARSHHHLESKLGFRGKNESVVSTNLSIITDIKK